MPDRGQIVRRGTRAGARIYVAGQRKWLGTFDTEREAQEAIDAALRESDGLAPLDCEVFAKRWMDDYPRPKASTREVNEQRARGFAEDFKGAKMGGPLSRSPFAKKVGLAGQPDRVVARRWARENPHALSSIRAMFNDALNDGLISVNPFAKLGLAQSRGRKDITPPSAEEVSDLATRAAEIHEDGGAFASQILFAAYTGVRPGELWELRWGDLDLRNLEARVSRRVWNGTVDTPKNGKARTITVPPPARDALIAAPRRADTDLLFTTKRGKPFTKGSHVYYWNPVRAAAGLQGMDFYDLRHFCATHLLELGLSPADVAVQLGHTDGGRLVMELYGHPSETRARERLKRAFQTNVAGLSVVKERKASNG